MAEKKNTALVISGGGAKGAFAVGVINWIYDKHRNNGWFDIVGGTSTGALISPMAALMGHKDKSIREEVKKTLEHIYSSVHTKDILDKENIFQLIFRMHSLYQSDRLKKLIQSKLRSEWFEWLQGKEAPDCYVVYVNYQSGKKKYIFAKEVSNRDEFIEAMMASASVPVVMEGTFIDKELCYDGGVRDLLPFAEAINRGAQRILPIFLDPKELNVQQKPRKKIYNVLLRTIEILVDEAGQNDYKMADLINMGIQIKHDLLQMFTKDTETLKKIREVLDKQEYQDLVGPGKRVISIIDGLRPDQALTDDSLKFVPEKMKKWMDMGRKKAGDVIKENPFL
jgi:NTE family protein